MDHLELIDMLKNTKGRWALSYYHFDELETMLSRQSIIGMKKLHTQTTD